MNGLPATRRMASRSPISIENCTQACRTFEKTRTSRGNATRRTSPAFDDTEPRPSEVISEKKFHGSSPHRRKNAKLSRPEGLPIGAWAPSRVPKTKP